MQEHEIETKGGSEDLSESQWRFIRQRIMPQERALLRCGGLIWVLIAVICCGQHGCSVVGEEQKSRLVRVAFVHHALDMGGVERQIQATWGAVDKSNLEAEVILCVPFPSPCPLPRIQIQECWA